jgi:hypothetical protein
LDAELHTLILYGGCALAIAVTAVTRRKPRADVHPSSADFKALWPFALVAVVETLNLNADGHLVAEWLLPGMASLVVVAFCHSRTVMRWTRRGLVLLCVLLWLHGTWLLAHGYVTRATPLLPGRNVEAAWFTRFTGLRREYREQAGGVEPVRAPQTVR